ncbi:MAG: inorganic diphosphatase [Anaerolineales bacterium]|jgi:inorganic pyrophosphatase
MDLWRDLPAGPDPPNEVYAVVECPKGTENKYQFDTAKSAIILDRVLYTAMHYPGDYGFIPRTLDDDGDPLDVLVLVTNPTFPGCIIAVRPIGILRMEDETCRDDKILAVPTHDPRFNEYLGLDDAPPHILQEIAHLFKTYKTPEGKVVNIIGWENSSSSKTAIEECRARFRSTISARKA